MNEIEILARCQWLPVGNTCRPLADLGVAHGFFGKGEVPPEKHHLRQIHGTKVVAAEPSQTGDSSTRRVEADGLFTFNPGTTIAVKTADCLPVIGVDRQRRAAFALHAGWRGLSAGIIGRAISELDAKGIKPADWICVIGPAIARDSYEVGAEVIEALVHGGIDLNPSQIGLSTAKGKGDRWHLDSAVAGVFALCNAGVPPEQVAVVQADTFKLDHWYSYRRDGKGVPSNWSWVTL